MDIKKSRTFFNPYQLSVLDDYYSNNQFPKNKERQQIAHQLGISLLHVQVWFQNKRAKEKRKKKKQALVSSKKFIPKPPSFWPNNVPFNSKITDVLKQSTEMFPATLSSTSSSCLLESSSQSVTVTSLSELPVTSCDQIPLADQPCLDVGASGYSMPPWHQVNVSFGVMRQNSIPNSSESTMPVNDSLNPVVLELMTRSTHIESANLAAIESPVYLRHTFPTGELPEVGGSRVDFLNSSAEFSTSPQCRKYYYINDDHIGCMMEKQVGRHLEMTQSYSDIIQCPATVEATLHAPMLP